MSIYYLNWDQNNPAGRIYWAYRVSQLWIESSATWNTYDGTNLWTTPGSDYTITGGASAVVPSSNYTWMTWDVTDIVKEWIKDGQPNNGFVIRDGDETGSTIFQSFFSTSEASSNQPILEISFTPFVGGDIIAVTPFSLLVPGIIAVVLLIGTLLAYHRPTH
jgi:hypothetical protein